ncbi:MAG TPA: hypothetical protein VF881_17730 [Polyangiaceae bacterium]
MLTKDVRLEGWTSEDWSRLLTLWKSSPENGSASPRGGLLIIHSDGRVRKMLHTSRGRLDKDAEAWPAPLPHLAAKHGARWVLAAPTGGLEKIAERFGARSRRDDDLSSQARLLLEIVRELITAGILELWPNRIDRLSLPPWPLFENTFEAIYPPGHLVLIALFDQGELFTSIALQRDKGGISRIVGPDDLRKRLSFLSGDFRRDYRFALAAAEDAFGPVAFGCFSELTIFRALQMERSWSAWVRALAIRDIIVTPVKGSLASPIAADAAIWAAAALNSLGRRWDSLGLILSLWRRWR